jgi:hypothetical protein
MKLPAYLKTFFVTVQKTMGQAPIPELDLLFNAEWDTPRQAIGMDYQLGEARLSQCAVNVALSARLKDGRSIDILIQSDGLDDASPLLDKIAKLTQDLPDAA